jgi:hypothetical protein
MGIYFEETTDIEDINFIKELIYNGYAYFSNKQIHYLNKYRFEDETEEGTTILWEECDINCKEKYLGENKPIQTPWGIGKWTGDGINYIYLQLMKQGRFTSTL